VEQGAVFPQQRVQVASVERADTAPQDEVLRGRDDRDRVDLHAAEVLDEVEDRRTRRRRTKGGLGRTPRMNAIEPLRPHREAADVAQLHLAQGHGAEEYGVAAD
jgi:hypothetical protein